MTQLIATPEKYKDKKIIVIGYYSGIDGQLYLSKKHAEIGDNRSGVYIVSHMLGHNVLPSSSCNGKYIEIRGEFRQTKNWNYYTIQGVKRARGVNDTEWCWELSEE